jgi:hypothetical protein
VIELLDHRLEDVANQIRDVFQRSYKVEAQLLEVEEFRPLQRSASQIQTARGSFVGHRVGTGLAAVIECLLSAGHLSIDSLVVHPQHFRCGLTSESLDWLLDRVDWRTAAIETAAVNVP